MSAAHADHCGGAQESTDEAGPRGGRTTGAGVILVEADPDTDWERVAQWVLRARAEGVIKGVGR